MKILLWKELRQNTLVLVLVFILMVLPYLMAGLACVSTLHGYHSNEVFHDSINLGSALLVILNYLIAAILGGVLVAGERGERSSEFIGYLPLKPFKVITSKLLLGFGVIFTIAIIDSVAIYLIQVGKNQNQNFWDTIGLFALYTISLFLAFSLSWFLGSWCKKVIINVLLGAVVFVGFLWLGRLLYVEYCWAWGSSDEVITRWFLTWCIAAALVLIVIFTGGGSAIIARRLEP